MVVNSTELQNNFGKYLRLCRFEDVIVSKNGRNIAKLVKYQDEWNIDYYGDGVVREKNPDYYAGEAEITYEEFLEISEASENRYEYINGRIYLMTSPGVTHQRIQTNMILIFGTCFKGKKCKPFVSPFDITLVKFEDEKNVVQPDLIVICDLEEMTNEKDRYMGTPELVVEILSKTTKRKDMVLKMDLYMNSGVKEYWIVNPFNRRVYLHTFEDGYISESFTWKDGETAESVLFSGLKLSLSDIFA